MAMKSIREKAKEAERNTHPLFESISESTGEPVSVYDQNDMISMFEQGANYVVEEIENLVKTTIGDGETYHYNLYIGLVKLLEQLKK
jgi:hypothetical protein